MSSKFIFRLQFWLSVALIRLGRVILCTGCKLQEHLAYLCIQRTNKVKIILDNE